MGHALAGEPSRAEWRPRDAPQAGSAGRRRAPTPAGAALSSVAALRFDKLAQLAEDRLLHPTKPPADNRHHEPDKKALRSEALSAVTRVLVGPCGSRWNPAVHAETMLEKPLLPRSIDHRIERWSSYVEQRSSVVPGLFPTTTSHLRTAPSSSPPIWVMNGCHSASSVGSLSASQTFAIGASTRISSRDRCLTHAQSSFFARPISDNGAGA